LKFLNKWSSWLTLLARLVLGGTLLIAGYLKIGNSYNAQTSVRVYKLLPVGAANFLGLTLPWIEVALGLFLIVGIWVRKVALASGVLMLIFIFAIGQAWARKLPINCGCFGNGGVSADGKVHALTYLTEIVRDIGLVLISYFLYRFPHGKLGLDKAPVLEEIQGE
jgi:uncharacterized membrane protein YphA (DoxX/SURF4 family)